MISTLTVLRYRIFGIISLCLLTVTAQTQVVDFTTPVSFHYDGIPLSSILDDLTTRYGVGFSYSRQIIPVDQKIYAHADQQSLGEAINLMFSQTQVIYGAIGDQIVLSIDLHKTPVPPDMAYFHHGHDDSLAALQSLMEPRSRYDILPLAGSLSMVSWTPAPIAPETVAYDLHAQIKSIERHEMVRARITFVPPLYADTNPHSDAPVNVSFNVLAGVNDSVDGFELGGLVNVTRDHFSGFQAAGLTNVVNHDLEGFQAAGLVNIVNQPSSGAQAAGLVNVAGGGVNGQVAGLANIAGGESHAQIAGLLNVANHARGAQIGLFNFCDTTDAVPIGLVSIVRHRGYHSLELSGEDAIDFNMNLRLGVRGFYNIFHVGLDKKGENWSLGYGLGTSIWLAARNYLQFEILARQINENEPWTSELNLLTQLRMNYDFALGKNIRVALGPSFNVSTSRRFDPETGAYGTDIPRYVIYEHTYDDGYRTPLNVKYWVGIQAGIRFGSADYHRFRGMN